MRKKQPILIRTALALFMVLCSVWGWGQTDITPVRNAVSGYPNWTDTNVAGTTYLQLLVNGANTVTPSMNFDAYTNEQLSFTARTFGGTNAIENTVTISISTDNGSSWNIIGTRTPTTNSLTDMTPFDLSSYNGTEVKLRFSVAGSSNSIGIGIDDIKISGIALPSCQTSNLAFTNTTVSQDFSAGTYTQTASSLNATTAIAYSSSDTGVATVDANTGEVTFFTAGTTTITATQAEGDHNGTLYCAETATYDLTITSSAPSLSVSGTADHGVSCLNTALLYKPTPLPTPEIQPQPD